jgi:AsmA protein
MKLFFKISLSLIALSLVLVIGFAIAFNPNDYKDDIIKIVKDKTGRELSIPGDISLSLFPWIGIDLGAIEISNAKGFGKQPFAKMAHLQVRAKLWPLFAQKLEADTLVIKGLNLNLTKNKQGVSNWDDLTKTKVTPKTTTKTVKKKDTNKQILAAFALNGVDIKNAQFNWHDQQQKQKVTIKGVQLSVGQLKPDTKVPFDFAFHLQEKSLDAKIKFDSVIVFSSDFKQFSFHDTQFASDMKVASLKKRLSPQLNSVLMKLDLEKQTFSTKALNLSANALSLQTKISAKQLFTTPAITSQIVISSFNPRILAEDLAVKLPDMADKKAFTQLSAQLNINGTLKKINVTNIELSLDDTKLVGNAKIKPTSGSSAINLVVDNINLDRYLPKPLPAKHTAKTSKNEKVNEVALIPVALLSKINVDADFKIKKIQIKKTHWTDFNFVAHSKNGHVNIKPLTMKGYDSTIQSNFTIKAVKNTALLSGKINIDKIKAGKLLSDFLAKDKYKGQTSLVADFTTSGVKLSQLKQNLNGTLKLDLKDATIKGFDLHHQQKVLDAKLKGSKAPPAPKPEETKIAKLTASAIIKKGVLNNKDLRASTPLSRIAGKGTVDIAKEKLNYVASVKFTSSTHLKATTAYEKMNKTPLDILIKGTFDKPIIKVDFQKVLNRLIKKKLKKQETKIKDKVKKDIKKELEKKLGDELKDLLKI